MKLSLFMSVVLAAIVITNSGCNKEKGTEESADSVSRDAPVFDMSSQSSGDPNEVVASVNDHKLTRQEMNTLVNNLMGSQQIPAEQLNEARQYFEQNAVRSFILKEALLDEAKKQNVELSAEDRAKKMEEFGAMLKKHNQTIEQYFAESPLGAETAKAEFEEGILIDKLIHEKVIDAIEVPEAEIASTLAEITESNAKAEEHNKSLAENNAAAKAKLEGIKKELDNGADFAELAQKHSDCPSGQKGGDLGEFTHGQMVKPFEEAAFAQPINQVGGIVETQFGYHLIKTTAKKGAVAATADQPAQPESVQASHILIKKAELQQVQPLPDTEDLKKQLKQSKARDKVQEYIQEVKAAAKVETIFTDLDL